MVLAHQLEAVVVRCRPPQRRLDHLDEVEHPRLVGRLAGHGAHRSGGAPGHPQRKLVPRDEVTCRCPTGVPLGAPGEREMCLAALYCADTSRERNRCGATGDNPRHGEAPACGDDAVVPQCPGAGQPRDVPEAVGVLDDETPPARSERDPNGAVHPCEFAHHRVRYEVRCHQAVGHEVGVVRRVPELAAVREAPTGGGTHGLADAVVLPFPDEAALQTGGVLEHAPVVGERAVRVAHRVAVLAHDERPVSESVPPVHLHRPDRRVHRADDVGDIAAAVNPAGVEHGALVVERSARVRVAHPRGKRLVMGAVSGLVAEGPEDDARVVAVTLHHAGAPREPRAAVAGVVAQARVVRVALDVRLVHHVQADLVAEVEEAVVVRVMGAADSVDVVALHRHEVGTHVVHRDGFAALGVVVVAVDATDHHALCIHEQRTVTHLHRPEADGLCHHLASCAVGRDQFDEHPIALRDLGRPGEHPRHRAAQ
ncbi:unannotated protein [freshwater metagenome]|uniref:Unannotated protein n=1 Tax=freshwater metagenome TaxID=449393 RepID=A0A6J7US61_9ZZZZ